MADHQIRKKNRPSNPIPFSLHCLLLFDLNNSENMAAHEKDRFIRYLVDKVNMFESDKRATELAVEEFQSQFDSVNSTHDSMRKEMESHKAELHNERLKRKKAGAKANKLDQQLKYAQKNKFGDKRQNARKDENKDDVAVFHPNDDSKGLGRIIEGKSVKVFSFMMFHVEEPYDMEHYVEPSKKYSPYYGSDEGVEMAVAYHCVISTVKHHSMSCWRYLGEFFKKTVQTSEKKTCFQFYECSLSYTKIFNGCRDFFSLTPANIGMAYAKYRSNENETKFTWLLLSAADIHKIIVNSNVIFFNTLSNGALKSALNQMCAINCVLTPIHSEFK